MNRQCSHKNKSVIQIRDFEGKFRDTNQAKCWDCGRKLVRIDLQQPKREEQKGRCLQDMLA